MPAPGAVGELDIEAFVRENRVSAQEKASEVVHVLDQSEQRAFHGRPYFISIGGGDGEELAYLLEHTRAGHGIVLEDDKGLAARAQSRQGFLPQGKFLEVRAGPVRQSISQAVKAAAKAVQDGAADCIVVTCHSVLHEAFQDPQADLPGFFGTIFSEDVPVLFTYREPAVPRAWPEKVRIYSQSYSTRALEKLSSAIIARQPRLAQLPTPDILGESLRAHRDIALELFLKLACLSTTAARPGTQLTAVDHMKLGSYLWLAVGDAAHHDRRARTRPDTVTVTSLADAWDRLELGLMEPESGKGIDIPIAHERIVAWKIPRPHGSSLVRSIAKELTLASDALDSSDDEMLKAWIASKGRSWVESTDRTRAIHLLTEAQSSYQRGHPVNAWSQYLLGLDRMFSGQLESADWFSSAHERDASSAGLSLLFKAERMEALRKLGKTTEAVDTANEIFVDLPTRAAIMTSDIDRYVVGTTRFLLANLLRLGGLYADALGFIEEAESTFKPGVASHADELAHCYYGRSVCEAIVGMSQSGAQFATRLNPSEMQFADALIKLADSHALWFLNRTPQAQKTADAAASAFAVIGAEPFARRARSLSKLLGWWDALLTKPPESLSLTDDSYGRVVGVLIGNSTDYDLLNGWIETQRPSEVAGILQFAAGRNTYVMPLTVKLPRALSYDKRSKVLSWRPAETATSLADADKKLRYYMALDPTRRIPLLTDSD